MTKIPQFFIEELLHWNKYDNDRLMPWKGVKDPYKIWLSEIILQQTRVEQGLNYYNRFIANFPDVHTLAAAPQNEVFKLWEGLGYYSRCKNLIITAKIIANDFNGIFPNNYNDILQLKGIGPYTAAAIASFAFNLPHAVVDGNVFRVLSRYFGIDTPIDSTIGKMQFTNLANDLLDKKNAGTYNQAIMDFGAVICKPKLPLCANCVLAAKCTALNQDLVAILPVKEKKIIKRSRWFYYLIIEHEGKQYIRKRGAKDIWENLYEFVLIENDKAISLEKVASLKNVTDIFGGNQFEVLHISPVYKQLLTHQTIHGQFIKITTNKSLPGNNYEAVSQKEISLLPFPQFVAAYLKDKNVSLKLF